MTGSRVQRIPGFANRGSGAITHFPAQGKAVKGTAVAPVRGGRMQLGGQDEVVLGVELLHGLRQPVGRRWSVVIAQGRYSFG